MDESGAAQFLVLVSLSQTLRALSAAAEIVICVPDQQLAVIDRGKLISKYAISTSKFGDHLPAGAVIKNRVPTGEVVNVNAPGRDAIVSRVIWLRGMEQQNRSARDRCIYIHGTPEERQIGTPASFGCIRMRSHDVIALYDLAHIGMHVTVTPKRIADFIRPEEPSLLARAD